MSPKRRTAVNEFDQYTPAAQAGETRQDAAENVNAFTFDKEFELLPGEGFDSLPVIDSVKANLIYPDVLQPRPSPLPYAIRLRFRRGEIDAFQAARDWLRQAEKDAVIQHDIARYLSMGESIANQGQINPITGRWEEVPASQAEARTSFAKIKGSPKRIFRIETGEQRFWSAVIHHIHEKLNPEELTLRVSVVPESAAPTELATVRRQISENRKNMQLTEVLQAREIARLLLASISEKTGAAFTGDEADEYAYFRNVLQLGRVPHGVWDSVQAEFHLGQHRMRQSLEILNLPSPLLDLAHRARLSYRTLSQILKQPEAEWESAVWEAALQNIQFEDSEDEEGSLSAQPDATKGQSTRKLKKPVDSAELAYRGVRRFYRSAIKGVHANPLLIQSVADNVLMDGYAEEVVDFMEELVAAIRQRLNEQD